MSQTTKAETTNKFWWQHMTSYHWFVFMVASAAWFFDCLDQRLFSLARVSALSSLIDMPSSSNEVQALGKQVTAWFLIGWGIGGLLFGALGDRYGRARMLTVTILTYSLFTGLSFFSVSWIDFTIYRFLTGLGVGGVFGLAVALIAETVVPSARTQCLGMLQVLSTIGNLSAGGAKYTVDALEASHTISEGWRYMFLIGALPALMVIFTGWYLREPETWLKLKEEGKLPKGGIFSPYFSLMKSARWRKNLIVGALLASTGVVGLWAIGEYAVDLQNAVFGSYYAETMPDADEATRKLAVQNAKTNGFMLNMLGAAVGMWLFTQMAIIIGRKPSFVIGFTSALIITFFVYWKMETPTDAYWMMPLMGAAQLGPFAGFAIYLPELFPGSLRSTGTSFCYNLGRFAAAIGSFFSYILTKNVFGGFDAPLPYRYSAMVMCSIFVVGIVAAFFGPETKGAALPEEATD